MPRQGVALAALLVAAAAQDPTPAPALFRCVDTGCVPADDGVSKADCDAICTPPDPTPPPVPPAADLWRCIDDGCVPDPNGVSKADCQMVCTAPGPTPPQPVPPQPVPPGTCLADGLCCGDSSNCCNATSHKTLKCGVGGCNTCKQTVEKISSMAGQGCDAIGPAVCATTPVPTICETIVAKSCNTILQMLQKGLSPENICDSLGFCSAGRRCGCLADGECTSAKEDCCLGRMHATATCGGQLRCGCVPTNECADVSIDCCSRSFHKTMRCGGGVVGGRCN